MAVNGLLKLSSVTIEIPEARYDALIKTEEQLRILKNFIRSEKTFTKNEIISLIETMEAKSE